MDHGMSTMNKMMWVGIGVWLVCMSLAIGPSASLAAERIEEATIVGTDRSGQAGQVPSDTRASAVESKLKKEETPSGLSAESPGVRMKERMERPRMDERRLEKPEPSSGGSFKWLWILVVIGLVAAAG